MTRKIPGLLMLVGFLGATVVSRDTTFWLPPGGRAELGAQRIQLPAQPARYPIPQEVQRRLPADLKAPLQRNLDALMMEWPRATRLQVGPGDTLWLLLEGAEAWKGYALPDFRPVAMGPGAWLVAWARVSPKSWMVLDTAGRVWQVPAYKRKHPPEGPPMIRIPGATSLVTTDGRLWVATRSQAYRFHRGLLGVRRHTRTPGGWLLAFSGNPPGLLDTLGQLWISDTLASVLPPGSHHPGWVDWNQDGLPDLVFLYRNHPYVRLQQPDGSLWAPDTSVVVRFPFRRGFAPSLAFRDSVGYVATPEGKIYRLHRNGRHWQPDSQPLVDLRHLVPGEDWGLLYPVLAIGDSSDLFVVGLADGRVLALPSPHATPQLLGRVPEGYAAPVRLNDAWYAGNAAGEIRSLASGVALHLEPPPDSGSVFPAAADLTGDGVPELIVGQQKGGIRVYQRVSDTLWQENPSLRLATPEMAQPAPVDLNGDGRWDLAVSTLGGRVFAYESQETGAGLRLVERNSWQFRPQRGVSSLTAYYERSYLSPAGLELQVPADTLWAYARLLQKTPDPLLDEVAFSLAHTPPEILRVLARLHQEDLFLENARGVYRADTLLDYATLIDLANGRTTIVYAEGDTLPPDLYGWYVVHPRILFEVPYRVDASFWERRWQEYGMDRLEWLQHQEDVYAHPEQGDFWRTLFQHDSTYGQTALDAVAPARTLHEAVRRLYLFQGWNTGGCMTFGYRTQDLQPVVIYRKAYGSCGEQSILFTALARTALIPTYVAIDMGEDHQWNEFWCGGTWHHLDVNSDTVKGIDHPATSVMKKTITAVVGWRPDDSLFVITGRYVDTASVDFQVLDTLGTPVPGALVVLRSHWNHRDMRALWGYTDTRGLLHLPVGYQPPLGNAVEVLSPVGVSGIEHVLHKPGQRYRERLEVPGQAAPMPESLGLSLESTAFLWVHNPITSRPYRISSATLREAGYEGTLYQPLRLGTWQPRVWDSAGTWILRNPHPYLTLQVRARIPLEVPDAPPKATLTLGADTLPTGSRLGYQVALQAPRGLARAQLLVLRGNQEIQQIPLHHRWVPEEQTPWLVLRAGVRDSLDTGAGGPLRPGVYHLQVAVTDLSGQADTSAPVAVYLQPTHRFHRQWVYQDDPQAAEPSASWILEFWVREPLRLLYIASEAPEAEGLDLDLFLYRDEDGDGQPSKRETVVSSTSPTNHEVILVHFPKPGHYWLYAQGCTVETPPQPFNLTCSFVVDSSGTARP